MADGGTIYRSRAIDFGGIERSVAYPADHHARSPLLALSNALVLKGRLTLPKETGDLVPLQSMVMRVQRKYRQSLGRGAAQAITNPMNQSIIALSQHINVSVDFTKTDGVRSTNVNLDVFQRLSVKLHHCWCLNPEEDVVAANAIGVGFHEVFRAEDPNAPIVIENEGQAVNLQEVAEFLQGPGLTNFGLQQLIESTLDDEVFVLFWNRSFHTLIKHDTRLYCLHNYMETMSTEVVWREFNLQGDGQFFTSNFVLIPAVQAVTAEGGGDAVIEAALGGVSPDAVIAAEAALGGVSPASEGGVLPDQSGSSSSQKSYKYLCNRHRCQHGYASEVNLNRHKQIHSKDLKVTTVGYSKVDIGKYWDKLNNEDARLTISIEDMKLQHMHADVLLQIIAQTAPDDTCYVVANKLKDTLDAQEKISSNELFALLDEGSEGTAFSTDIRHCSQKVLSCEMGIFALKDTRNVIASLCFFLEKKLIDSWSAYMGVESEKLSSILLDADKDSRCHICPNPDCSLKFFSQVNYNRHLMTHLEDPNDKDLVDKRTLFGDYFANLTESDLAGPMLSLDKVNIKAFKWKKLRKIMKKVEQNPISKKLLEAIVTKKTTAAELFALLDDASERTSFSNNILSCEDDKIFKECTSTPRDAIAAVSYFLEKNVAEGWLKSMSTNTIDSPGQTAGQQHSQSATVKLTEEKKAHESASGQPTEEKKPHERVSDMPSVDGLSSGSSSSPQAYSEHSQSISFKEYIETNKLIKRYRMRPRNFFKPMKKRMKNLNLNKAEANRFLVMFKLSLVILTRAGRKCARGFLNHIVKNHLKKKSWNGNWALSDMVVMNGQFIITKEASEKLTADSAAEDLKKFFELVLKDNFYCSDLKSYPPYFEEFQHDILKVPDPDDNADDFVNFERYIALHFAFMPPFNRSTVLVHLHNAYESDCCVADSSYFPLNGKMQADWRANARQLPLLDSVYFYDGTREPYSPTYFHLLRYSRHFISHDMDHTKIGQQQMLLDMMITDMVLAQILAPHLTELIHFIVKTTNMGGRAFWAFHTLEASDGEVFLCPEVDKDDSSSEESSDDSSDE